MPIPASNWYVSEVHKGKTIAGVVGATNYYQAEAFVLVLTTEADRYKDYWDNTLTNTSGGVMTLGTVSLSTVTAFAWSLVYIIAYNSDPETVHETLIADIQTTETALAANDTQVTQANTITTGEIAVYAAGKITAVIARP